MCSQLQYTKYTQLNVLNHNRRQRTVSANGFKWFDITCVADRKSNLLQYHENARVITGTETVTKHLATQRNCWLWTSVVKILAYCGVIGDDASQVSEVFHCVYVGAIDADVRRTVFLTWRGLVQYLSLLQADGEAEVLGCIREAIDVVL